VDARVGMDAVEKTLARDGNQAPTVQLVDRRYAN
jgi:hypothetical protein